MPLKIGSITPTLELPTDCGGTLPLTSLMNKNIVLFFYQETLMPACAAESSEFEAANIIIVGVSKDSIKQLGKFKAKYQLPFTLVSDEEGALSESYDVWRLKELYGKECVRNVQSNYLIDESSHIQAVWDKVRVKRHVYAIL